MLTQAETALFQKRLPVLLAQHLTDLLSLLMMFLAGFSERLYLGDLLGLVVNNKTNLIFKTIILRLE
jgi:hypothetical protein